MQGEAGLGVAVGGVAAPQRLQRVARQFLAAAQLRLRHGAAERLRPRRLALACRGSKSTDRAGPILGFTTCKTLGTCRPWNPKNKVYNSPLVMSCLRLLL